MIKLLKKLGRNNKGSSLVIAIIAVSFVAILGTVIISSTMTNYSMRVMNYQSKKTFYSAQTALDEIYLGISTECYNQLETAYLSSVTGLVNNNRAVDNATANSNMRILYLTNLKKKTGYGKWRNGYFGCLVIQSEFNKIHGIIHNQD